MNTIETRAGVLIFTHRTPAPEREMLAAFWPYWLECNANQCIQVTFEIKPIFFNDDQLAEDSETDG